MAELKPITKDMHDKIRSMYLNDKLGSGRIALALGVRSEQCLKLIKEWGIVRDKSSKEYKKTLGAPRGKQAREDEKCEKMQRKKTNMNVARTPLRRF